jgi:REP element-mobilizing transposase RayT
MAKPARNAHPDRIVSGARTFFVTTKNSQGRSLFQSERNAALMIDVLRSYVAAGKFRLHDFVIMPNHVHLLITVGAETTIEKAMQYVKGGFSYRLKKEYGYVGEVWQRGSPKCGSKTGKAYCNIGSTLRRTRWKPDWSIRRRSSPIALRTWQGKRRQGLKPTKVCIPRHD